MRVLKVESLGKKLSETKRNQKVLASQVNQKSLEIQEILINQINQINQKILINQLSQGNLQLQ